MVRGRRRARGMCVWATRERGGPVTIRRRGRVSFAGHDSSSRSPLRRRARAIFERAHHLPELGHLRADAQHATGRGVSAPVHRVTQAKNTGRLRFVDRTAPPYLPPPPPGSSSPATQERERRPRDGFSLRARLRDRSLELGRLVLLPTPRASHHGEVGHGLTQRAALRPSSPSSAAACRHSPRPSPRPLRVERPGLGAPRVLFPVRPRWWRVRRAGRRRPRRSGAGCPLASFLATSLAASKTNRSCEKMASRLPTPRAYSSTAARPERTHSAVRS